MNYDALMDEKQKQLHEHFPPSHYLHKSENVQRLLMWITYYRRNPSRFVEHYFGIALHLYQHIILYLMEYFPSFCIVAARSAAKSFLIAVFACKEAILRPGARIVVASATKKQARLIVSEKIKKELLPKSPLLADEIDSFKDNQNEIEVVFKNGSSIVVVAANENARGYRATVMIYEEFRMIAKNIIDSVLSPFLYVRQTDYLKQEEYAGMQEEPKEVYISSAWYQNHWMWNLIKTFTKDMLAKVLFDEERNVEYKPWKCMNDDKVANRIQIAGAEENVYIIKAQLETNSNIAESMRNALNSGMIDLLISNTEAVDEIANFIPEYASADVDTQLFFERPYIETVALINEMINLEYERGDQTGLIKIMNNSDRKDRYTSVSYGNYFAQMLEHDLLSDTAEYDYVPLFN